VWDAAVAASPCATPFHSRAWCETYAGYDRRFEARALSLRLDRAGEVLLPLLVRRGALRRGPFARAVAAQPGVYGGPISPAGALDEGGWEDFVEAARSLPFARIDFFDNVLDPLPAGVAAALGASSRSTHVIDLRELPADSRSTFAKGCKHALTKARRAGIAVSRLGSSDVAAYFAVYRDSLARWGKGEQRAYRRELFERLAATDLAELWGARLPDGELAAGGVFLFAPRHCVWWHGAMKAAHADSGPSNALIHALVEEARRRGCELFDFNPSGGHAGVESFKRSFSPRAVELSTWTQRSQLSAHLRRGDRSAG
jgi:CelD/BcsL family acetyltransferase involved in cellulose biosynthesis